MDLSNNFQFNSTATSAGIFHSDDCGRWFLSDKSGRLLIQPPDFPEEPQHYLMSSGAFTGQVFIYLLLRLPVIMPVYTVAWLLFPKKRKVPR